MADPEPREFRLLLVLAIGAFATGLIFVLYPRTSGFLNWLRSRDLLVPADQAALRLPGGEGVTWMTLAVGFLTIVFIAWLVSRLLSLLGLTK